MYIFTRRPFYYKCEKRKGKREDGKLIRAIRYKIIGTEILCKRSENEFSACKMQSRLFAFNILLFGRFQCDASFAVETAASLDRRREER